MARQYVLGENSARKLRELFNSGGGGSVRGAPASLAFEDEFAHPFEVRWAASAGEGGGWIVYLPSKTALIDIGGHLYDPTEYLEAVGGDYPPEWYLLDEEAMSRENAGKLYLVVGEIEGVDSAKFSASPELGGEDVSRYLICEGEVDASTGERKVRQFVSSAIIVGGGGGGGGGDGKEYYGDVQSISLNSGADSDSGSETGDVFQLTGFGKFNLEDRGEGGAFLESSEMFVGDTPDDTVAFVVRVGNSKEVNANTLQYKTLRVGSKSAFRLERVGEGSWRIVDCYYNVGGILNLAPASALDKDSLSAGCIAAFCLPSQNVRVFSSLEDLREAQKNADEYIVALYVFGAGGAVAVDLRTAPQVQYFEEGLV